MIATEILGKHYRASMEPKFPPDELRLSQTGLCPRMRCYGPLGYKPQDTAENAGIFEAGHVWEHWIAKLIAREYPDAQYEDPETGKEQLEVFTPYGATGHVDVWIPSQRLIIECKTTRIGARHYGLPKSPNVDQVQAYLHFHDRTARAELVYIFRENPSEYEVFPVSYNPTRGEEIEAELYFLAQSIQHELLPDRPPKAAPTVFPCFYATQDYDVWCPYHTYCWGGCQSKEGPPTVQVSNDELVTRYADVRRQCSDIAEMEKSLKAEKCRLENTLSGYFPEGKKAAITAAGLQISRTLVGRTSYSVEKAIEAGAVAREALEPFSSFSESFRYYVKEAR